jgi:hypothetical protein
MFRRVALLAVVGAVTAAAPAAGAQTITATGTKLVKVTPKNRKSNSSIQAAVVAAEKAGVKGAFAAAHANALAYGVAAGLKLGAVMSVSDAQSNGAAFGPYGPYPFYGPFGPNRYCGTQQRAVIKVINGKRKVVRVKKVHVCIVPPYEASTLTVTYAAT